MKDETKREWLKIIGTLAIILFVFFSGGGTVFGIISALLAIIVFELAEINGRLMKKWKQN